MKSHIPWQGVGASALAAALLLAGCASTHSSGQAGTPDDAQSAQTAQMAAFQKNGYLEQDVVTVASYLAHGIPDIPRIRNTQGAHSRVIVNANDVQFADDSVVLDRHAFTRSLLSALKPYSSPELGYVDRFELMKGARTSSNSGSSGSSGRGGEGSSSQHSSSDSGSTNASGPIVSYLLQAKVSRLPAEAADKAPVQIYEFLVVDAATRTPLWQGSFNLDAPVKPVKTP